MNILVIGESVLEITSVINTNIVEGTILRLPEKIECGGGHAGNIAYLLGKWGCSVHVASMLGADDAASKIKKEFESIGVKTDYIETSYDKQTGINLVLVNNTNKNNTVYEIASNAYLKKYSYVVEPNVIITDGYDLNGTTAAFDKYPKALRFLMASRYTNEVNELCRFANYIVFNRSTAENMSGLKIDYNDSGTIVNVYNKLMQKFNNAVIVVTLGEKGSVYSINGQVKIMPPVKLDIADTYGAGDAYTGAFAYAISKNFGLEKAICYATICASLSVGKMTSRNSFPSLTEVSTYYDGKFGAANNPNYANNDQNAASQSEQAANNNSQTVSEANTNAFVQSQEMPNASPVSSNNMNSNVESLNVGSNDNSQNA